MSEHHKRLGAHAQQAFRWAVLAKDNYTCQECGKFGGRQEAHHIVALSKGGSNESVNGITMCRNCHISHHRPTRTPERLAWDKLVGENIVNVNSLTTPTTL